MDIGIGLPATISGVQGGQLLEWARRAEARGFSTLGTIDRLVYGNYEPLIALAAAAAVTEWIRLATTIMIAPYRANGALVAKQAATVHHLSGGRLVLGAAVGGREDDYTASGVDFHTRGRRFDEMLDEWGRVWAGEDFGTAGAIGPPPPGGGPPVLIGGRVDAAFERAARHAGCGDGRRDTRPVHRRRRRAARRLAGGRPRRRAAHARARLLRARRRREGGGRPLSARLLRLPGRRRRDGRRQRGDRCRDGRRLRGGVPAGRPLDELVLFPCDPDPGQVDLLADAVL